MIRHQSKVIPEIITYNLNDNFRQLNISHTNDAKTGRDRPTTLYYVNFYVNEYILIILFVFL